MLENKTERINIRCTTNEKEAIKKAATETGIDNISEYLVLSALTLGFKDREAIIMLKKARSLILSLWDKDVGQALNIERMPHMPGLEKERIITEIVSEGKECESLINDITKYLQSVELPLDISPGNGSQTNDE